MEQWMWIAIGGGAAALVVIIIAWALIARSRSRRREHLRQQFGPEYEHAVREHGRGRGESELSQREKTAERLELRPLSATAARAFEGEWTAIQARFVDSPFEAITQAERLLSEVMQARGYPAIDYEQTVGLVAVHHPRAVARYREAHAVAVRNHRQEASTEDLRQALVHYRALFSELLEVGETRPVEIERIAS